MSDQDIANASNYDDLAWLNHRVSELEAQLEGRVLVPAEPTEAMIGAGVRAIMNTPSNKADELVLAIYRAMLKAVEGE